MKHDHLKLEQLAEQVTKLLSIPAPQKVEVDIDVKDTSLEEIKEDLLTLQQTIAKQVDYANEQREIWRDSVRNPHQEPVENFAHLQQRLTQRAELFETVYKTYEDIEKKRQRFFALHKSLQEKELREAGFASKEEWRDQVDTASAVRQHLQYNHFLGGIRFRKKIKELDDTISDLYGKIDRDYTFDYLHVAEFRMSDYDVRDMRRKTFKQAVHELFNAYTHVGQEMDKRGQAGMALTPEDIAALTAEYMDATLKPKIEAAVKSQQSEVEYHRKNILRGVGFYNVDDLATFESKLQKLRDPQLVSEALALAQRGGGNEFYPLFTVERDWSDEQIEEQCRQLTPVPDKASIDLLKQIHGLPSKVQTAIRLWQGDEKHTNLAQEFQNIADTIATNSFWRAYHTVHAAAQNYDKEEKGYVEGDVNDAFRKEIQNSDDFSSWRDVCSLLPPEQVHTFLSSPTAQARLGEETLRRYREHASDEIWKSLLVTNEHTTRSQDLGNQAVAYTTDRHLPHLIFNFWRETGTSGHIPFFNVHTHDVTKTIGHQYVAGLSDKQVKALAERNIPGLMDIVKTMRSAQTDYRQPFLVCESEDERVPNHEFTRVQKGIRDMTIYYLTTGTQGEQYFGLTKAINLWDVWSDQRREKQSEKVNTEEREQVINVVAGALALDASTIDWFKQEYHDFRTQISRRMVYEEGQTYSHPPFMKQIKADLEQLASYFTKVKKLIGDAKHPEAVQAEEKAMRMYIVGECHDKNEQERRMRKVQEYVQAFDQEIVQELLGNVEYGSFFRQRLNSIRSIDTSRPWVEDLAVEMQKDLLNFESFILTSENCIKPEKGEEHTMEVAEFLNAEQQRMLKNIVLLDELDHHFIHKHHYKLSYLSAVAERKTAERVRVYDESHKKSLVHLAYHARELHSYLTVPVIRAVVYAGLDQDQIYDFATNLGGALHRWIVNDPQPLIDLLETQPKKALAAVYALAELKDTHGEEIYPKQDNLEEFLTDVPAYVEMLKKTGFQPTAHLAQELHTTEDKEALIQSWHAEMATFEQGLFDSENRLHRNLEYTRFRAIVDHEKVRRHVKNHFTFNDYLKIFYQEQRKHELSGQDQFEIACVAHEAELLGDFITQVQVRAAELDRPVLVVPNLSYGYLPTSPLLKEIAANGAETIIGVKVGSTESHNNKEVVNSRLFKGHRTKLMKQQPIIVVVDGTKHLVARDNEHKGARYPDAYQGYLNQVIAMNDALGCVSQDYTTAGKNEEDMRKLRASQEFQRTVEVYKHVLGDIETEDKEAVSFYFWNTANKELIIRNYHEKIGEVQPIDPENIDGPAMIFCNVGVLDDQIPDKIKAAFPELETKHTPAYFDDSGKIINFDFSHDKFGVRYMNKVETAVIEAYQKSKGGNSDIGISPDHVPAIVQYLKKNGSSPGFCEENEPQAI